MNKQFDVVIGNPPYNNSMYTKFGETAFELLKPDGITVQITPCKFYALESGDNKHFRETVMTHMDELHVYKSCQDVFDIAEVSGITYWRAHKNKVFTSKHVTNYNSNAVLQSSREEHTEQPLQLMPLKCLALITKINNAANNKHLFDNYKLSLCYYTVHSKISGHDKIYEDDVEFMTGLGGQLHQDGYLSIRELKHTDGIDKYKVTHNTMIYSGTGLAPDSTNRYWGPASASYIKPGQIIKGSYVIAGFFDTEQEALSFLSYLNSQLVSFIIANSIASCQYSSQSNWRHVPALPAGYTFDHIYTDNELFDIFGLTTEEKDLITSLIKPRSEKEDH